MTPHRLPAKYPADVLDYAFDWTRFLPPDDQIADAAVTVTEGDGALTCQNVTVEGLLVGFWLSGGTVDASYELACRVTTVAGRTITRKAALSIASPA